MEFCQNSIIKDLSKYSEAICFSFSVTKPDNKHEALIE